MAIFTAKRAGEWLLNGISVLCLAFLATHVLGRLSAEVQPQSPPASPLVGKDVSNVLSEVPWDRAPQTIVLFTKSTCTYCQKNVPFHRQLLDLSSRRGIPVIAVSDEPQLNLEAALAAYRLPVTAAHSVPVARLEIRGTPTIAIVDAAGVIRRVWEGFVADERQREVLEAMSLLADDASLSIETEPKRSNIEIPYVSQDEFVQYSSLAGNKYILDIRPRAEFAASHVRGAINIPEDELEIRAPRELPREADVAVFCEYRANCEQSYAEKGVFTNCTMSTMLLRSLGLNARLLPVQLATSEESGLTLVRAEPSSMRSPGSS